MKEAQENFNLELLANVSYNGNGNDVWGYVSENGTEYAIVGSTVSTLIYSLEDPSNPILRTNIPGANSTWRPYCLSTSAALSCTPCFENKADNY